MNKKGSFSDTLKSIPQNIFSGFVVSLIALPLGLGLAIASEAPPLAGVLQAGRRLVMGVGLLMMMGAVLILANTIRLAIEARRDEIVVIKLIGANDAYARRPFLYTGLWSGFGGGLLGAIMVGVFFIYLSEPVNQLLQLYDSDRRFTGLGIMGVLNMMFLGGALGLLSAWHAATTQLRELEPR